MFVLSLYTGTCNCLSNSWAYYWWLSLSYNVMYPVEATYIHTCKHNFFVMFNFVLSVICGYRITDMDKVILDKAAVREINRLEVRCPFDCQRENSNICKLTIRVLEVRVVDDLLVVCLNAVLCRKLYTLLLLLICDVLNNTMICSLSYLVLVETHE